MGTEESAPLSPRPYYAHTAEDAQGNRLPESSGEWQLLADHLRNVANLAATFAAPFHASEEARLAGLLHDLGKYAARFQARLRDPRIHGINHWAAGAAYAANHGQPLIAYPIDGHHTGLPAAHQLRQSLLKFTDTRQRIELTNCQDDIAQLVNLYLADGLPASPLAPKPDTPRRLDPLPLSALNHQLYCERRAYLIHAERVFVDNEHTTLGQLAHAAVDHPGYEHRAGWELLRALPLFSDTLGLSGKADLVENRRAGAADASEIGGLSASGLETNLKSEMPRRIFAARPVEYKKGPARRWINDHVQLCAQALCLEEMLGLHIPAGLVFHVASAKRLEVVFDESLRSLVLATLDALRANLALATSPPAVLRPQCDGCSLHGVCLPEAATFPPRENLYEPRDYA